VWHPDPDQLALSALPAERRDAEVEAHLAACSLCRSHVASLRRTVDLALASGGESFDSADLMPSPDGADPDAPPDRVWRAITQELAIVADRPEEPDPEPVPLARHRARPSRWRRLALPVAAAVIGIAAGVGIGAAIVSPAGTPTGTTVAQLAPVTAMDPAGTGTVEMVTTDGRNRMIVRLDGVTDLAGADFLEAWLMDGNGRKLQSLGSLARDGSSFQGTFTVPAGLPAGEFDTVDISAEKWDGNPGHSRISLLRGSLA
jgi:Anti-sigma-K factor rskA